MLQAVLNACTYIPLHVKSKLIIDAISNTKCASTGMRHHSKRENGLPGKVNDAEVLAESNLSLLSQPENHRAISKFACEAIVNRFTLDKVQQAKLQIYQTLRGNSDYEL